MSVETGVETAQGTAALDETGEVETETQEGEEGSQNEQFIPYARFKKTNEDLKLTKSQYEALQADFDSVKEFRDFINELKAEGLKGSDDVRAFIAKQAAGSLTQQLEGAKQSAAVAYHKNIADGIDHDTALTAYNATVKGAELDYREKLLVQREAELNRTSTGSVAQKIKAAAAKYPEADEDILRKLSSVPGTDIDAEAKALHDKEIKRQANYAKAKGTQTGTRGAGTKEGTQSAPSLATSCPDPLKFPKEAQAWLDKAKQKSAAMAGA